MVLNALYRIPWLIMATLSVILFYICIFYWTFQPDVNFLQVKAQLVFHPVWRTVFYLHVFAGMVVIIAGPVQFLGFVRRQYAKVHRYLGKAYVGTILLIGAPTGLYMAFFAEGGTWASIGFTVMSIIWFLTTYLAFKRIKEKNFKAHSDWMVRSYAMSFSAVTLRLFVPLFTLGFKWDHHFAVVLTSWVSWIFNLSIAEALIRTNSKFLKL